MNEFEKQEELERKDRARRRKAARDFITNMNDADKQRLITYLAFLGLMVFSILSTSMTLLFDPENFDFKRYVISVSFNIVFSIIGLILSLKDGRLSNETRRKGLLFDTRQEFEQNANLIVDEDSFRQWSDNDYEKRKLNYIKNELSRINIKTIDYLKVPEKDFELLKTEDIEFEGNVLDKLTPYQYEIVEKYRKGDFVYKKIPYNFFKSDSYRDEYKYYADSGDKNNKVEALSFLYRIAMIILVPAIFGLAAVSPATAGAKTIAFETASRIMNVLTSIFMGYSLAHDEATRLIKSLIFKIKVIKQYLVDLDTQIFVPKSRTEQQMEKLREIRERRKAQATVVPEENEYIEMSEEEYKKYLENKDTTEKEEQKKDLE